MTFLIAFHINSIIIKSRKLTWVGRSTNRGFKGGWPEATGLVCPARVRVHFPFSIFQILISLANDSLVSLFADHFVVVVVVVVVDQFIVKPFKLPEN